MMAKRENIKDNRTSHKVARYDIVDGNLKTVEVNVSKPRAKQQCGIIRDGKMCGFPYESRAELEVHAELSHGIQMRGRKKVETVRRGGCCDVCGTCVVNLRTHKQNAHGHFTCSFDRKFGCTFRCESKTDLRKHVASAHPFQTERTQCSDCGILLSKINMNRHRERKHPSSIACTKCPFKGSSFGNLKEHVMHHHVKM